VPCVVPSEAEEFSAAPVIACRVRVALIEQGCDLRLIEVRSCFGFGGCGGVALASGFGTGFLACSDFSASAIGSTLGGSGFFSTGFGSSLACSRRPASADPAFSRPAFPPASAAAPGGGRHDFFFSVILPTASSTGVASATFSTIGFGLSFSPVLMPAVILES